MEKFHDTTTGQPNEILTRTGLAEQLKCSKRHLDSLQHQGLPCLWLGKSRRFILSEVIAWLRRKGATQ